MATEVGTAFITILPSADGFSDRLRRDLNGPLGNAGRSSGKRFGLAMMGAVGAVAAAGTMAVSFLSGSIEEATEALKVGKLTAQVIKTTGGAAKITADQVGDLAGSISAKVGIDDEAIQSGANLLLTFKNIRNELGKGNDIFDQATQAAVDLSAAGFGDLTGTSKQLGKALNDPIKGITALSKSGVTFTEKQKEMIKSMVEAGNTLGAQKIILQEINAQVGGAAEVQATAADKLAVKWGNFKEEVGTKLLPVIDKLLIGLGKVSDVAVSWLTEFNESTLSPAIKDIAAWFESTLLPILKNVWSFVRDRLVKVWNDAVVLFNEHVVPAVKAVGSALGDLIAWLAPKFKWLLERLGDVADFLQATLIPALGAVFDWIANNSSWAVPILAGIGAIIVAMGILDAVLALNPFVLLAIAVVAIGTLIYKNWNAIKKFFVDLWEDITGSIKTAWTNIQNFFAKQGQAIVDTFANAGTWLVNAGKWIGQGLWDGIKWVWDSVIVVFFVTLPQKIGGWFTGAAKWLFSAGYRMLKGFLDGIAAFFVAVGRWFAALPEKIINFIISLPKRLYEFGIKMVQGMFSGMLDGSKGKVKLFSDSIVSGMKKHFGINSPSRVFMELGRQMSAGLIQGLVAGNPVAFAKKIFGSLPGTITGLFKAGKFNITDLMGITDPKYSGTVSKLLGKMGTNLGGAFTGSVNMAGGLADWLRQAMSITGVPSSWLAPLISLAMHESGGNPSVQNNWDQNAMAGIPSKGLLQTIQPTFDAYSLPGLKNVWNPVHNAVAAIRYMLARYGSIFNIASYTPNGFVGGYEKGTNYVPHTGLALVHQGEKIIPAGAGYGMPSTLVVVDADGALIGRMHVVAAVEFDRQMGAGASSLVYGRSG